MFLVIKDEVFAVRRFDYKGESYLIHTDNQGKTSVLAKAPSEEDSGSQDNGGSTCAASGQKVSNTRGETTNVLSNTSEQSRHVSYQRGASHAQYQTEPHISSTPLHVNARENAPTTYDQRQTAYGGMRMPRRQLSNQTNAGPRAESSRYIPPKTTVYVLATKGTRAPNTLSRSWSNQQLIVNQDLAARNQTNNDAMNIPQSTAIYKHGSTGRIQMKHNTVSSDRQRYLNKETIDVDRRRGLAESSSVSAATHENRIAQRSELMKYIANQLASREGPAPSATNSSDFMNSASRRHEPGRPGQAYNENAAANEWLNRTASNQ
ncbi:hypothetical protein OS493_022851 [Desmophyllum pertusum]|uniref:Uncharacterized protein n=1 Tax=Desmophyllum pertusum TaxID=174260 RepID=A0A9X0D2J0_9CNID|nr:hypothetical protein OS493_022851 [Desmophyllum pertusum]